MSTDAKWEIAQIVATAISSAAGIYLAFWWNGLI